MEPTPTIPPAEPTTEPTTLPTPIPTVELSMTEVISTTQYVGQQQSNLWSSSDLQEPLFSLLVVVFLLWFVLFYRFGFASWLKNR